MISLGSQKHKSMSPVNSGRAGTEVTSDIETKASNSAEGLEMLQFIGQTSFGLDVWRHPEAYVFALIGLFFSYSISSLTVATTFEPKPQHTGRLLKQWIGILF